MNLDPSPFLSKGSSFMKLSLEHLTFPSLGICSKQGRIKDPSKWWGIHLSVQDQREAKMVNGGKGGYRVRIAIISRLTM